MVPFNQLTLAEQATYSTIVSWQVYIDAAITDFKRVHPTKDIASAEIKIEYKIFINGADIKGDIPFTIVFEHCYFNADLNFLELNCAGKISVMRCFCSGEIYTFESANFENEFNLIEVTARQVYMKGGKFDLCQWNINELGTIKIAGGDFKELNIGYWGGCNLKELTIDLNPKMSGLIRVTGEKSKIINFSIFKSTSDVSISIEDISVNHLSIYRYRNDKNFRITNLKSIDGEHDSEVSIVESYMGKAEFYNIDFRKFQLINIHNSHISDSSFVSVKWKAKITSFKGRGIGLTEEEKQLPEKIKQFESELDKDDYRQDHSIVEYLNVNREAYRQLKYVYSKQGDVINEQFFHSLEMRVFENTLGYEDDFWTKATLRFSHVFSNFGQSIGRPLRALFIGHFILFVLLIWTGGITDLSFNIPRPTWIGFEIGVEKFFKYINPLRKYDEDFQGYFIVFDISMRIWSSFMLYNIIRASRRFIK
ncbi:hypothetical protein AQ505_12735 [Pedobacter sp. PACM 27299]|uniref:hypothetical protein n=1 Tax=Pedobacter sp. PACM 27299 TaxID=1727164 RepID=UPI0007057ED9|nr:hypothetical protein [Pedobacter sp. PACM 27299]ALL06285.1 hypothetical protein AQ505_12735 [Pedobacter sp. PACM 27299]